MIKQLFKRKEVQNERPGEFAPLLPVGTEAPNFVLPATKEGSFSLKDFRGQPVVLVFYPADKSPVCSNQLALYNEALSLFQEHDAQLVGISIDDMASHQEFAEQLGLKFPLLADCQPTGAVSRKYGTLSEKDGASERALFVIDSDGIIRWRYISPRNINPGADGILQALDSITGAK